MITGVAGGLAWELMQTSPLSAVSLYYSYAELLLLGLGNRSLDLVTAGNYALRFFPCGLFATG